MRVAKDLLKRDIILVPYLGIVHFLVEVVLLVRAPFGVHLGHILQRIRPSDKAEIGLAQLTYLRYDDAKLVLSGDKVPHLLPVVISLR